MSNVNWSINVLKVARHSFSGSMPPKFEHKLCCHKQRFEKIATTVVLDKNENLLWSGLQRHWSCHSNGMMPLPILIYLQHWELFFQNRSLKLFPPIASSMFVKFKRNPALILLPYNMKIISRLKGVLKQCLVSGISIFQKNLWSGLKIIH